MTSGLTSDKTPTLGSTIGRCDLYQKKKNLKIAAKMKITAMEVT